MKHVTYRGNRIDMGSLRRENEQATAVGNMGVNAKGDKVTAGKVTKTADQIARENHRIQSAVVSTGLKGPVPSAVGITLEQEKVVNKPAPAIKPKEVELPNGDIVVGDKSAS